jgi:hypothetical protein
VPDKGRSRKGVDEDCWAFAVSSFRTVRPASMLVKNSRRCIIQQLDSNEDPGSTGRGDSNYGAKYPFTSMMTSVDEFPCVNV